MHARNCIGFICTCPSAPPVTDDAHGHSDDHGESCDCSECSDVREAEKDRRFDEMVALGYFI